MPFVHGRLTGHLSTTAILGSADGVNLGPILLTILKGLQIVNLGIMVIWGFMVGKRFKYLYWLWTFSCWKNAKVIA